MHLLLMESGISNLAGCSIGWLKMIIVLENVDRDSVAFMFQNKFKHGTRTTLVDLTFLTFVEEEKCQL